MLSARGIPITRGRLYPRATVYIRTTFSAYNHTSSECFVIYRYLHLSHRLPVMNFLPSPNIFIVRRQLLVHCRILKPWSPRKNSLGLQGQSKRISARFAVFLARRQPESTHKSGNIRPYHFFSGNKLKTS